MRTIGLRIAVFVVSIWAIPSGASATTCPDTAIPTTDNEYTLIGTGNTTVVTCVADNALAPPNIINGGADDDFLNGPNDDGTSPYFGGDWTSFCSTENATPPSGSGDCDEEYNFLFTSTGGNTSGTWSFTGVEGEEYVLVVKDGSSPFWAAFLLGIDPDENYTGTWGIVNGGLSHFAIYDRDGGGGEGTPQNPVPEPASLLLLGSGLGAVAHKIRRKKRAERKA